MVAERFSFNFQFFNCLIAFLSLLSSNPIIIIIISVPRHDKKEINQLSPVKKRVKENSPPHQQRYNRQHISPQYHQSSNHINYYTNNNGGNNSNNANNMNNHGHQFNQHHQTASNSQLIAPSHASYSNSNSMPISHSSSHSNLKQQQVVRVVSFFLFRSTINKFSELLQILLFFFVSIN